MLGCGIEDLVSREWIKVLTAHYRPLKMGKPLCHIRDGIHTGIGSNLRDRLIHQLKNSSGNFDFSKGCAEILLSPFGILNSSRIRSFSKPRRVQHYSELYWLKTTGI